MTSPPIATMQESKERAVLSYRNGGIGQTRRAHFIHSRRRNLPKLKVDFVFYLPLSGNISSVHRIPNNGILFTSEQQK